MSDYNRIKNLGITIPESGMELGSNGNRFGNLYISGNIVLDNTTILSSNSLVPKITSISYVGNDTAADPAGDQTITITGSGFMSGLFVYVGGVIVASSTYVNSTTATFVAPAKTAGIYTLVIANPDGGTATYITGMQYSGVPSWTTTAGSLANVYEYSSVSSTVAATGDAPITYSLAAGNSLPSGLSIGSSNGVISGTTTSVASGSTTTNFYLSASDGQNQDTSRNFSITVNADVVTWSSPANATSYSSASGTAISTITLSASSAAGKSISYTANSLPTGLSLSGSTITGTPTVTGNSSSIITATAATTGKTATRTLNWVITNPFTAATGGTVTTSGNYKIHTFTGSGDLIVTVSGTVDYLVVAGGGGGGSDMGGGGGAGGMRYGTQSIVAGSTYTIVVGGGGAGAGTGNGNAGTVGVNSSALGLTSNGGGRGGGIGAQTGGNGGSGGGAGGNTSGGTSIAITPVAGEISTTQGRNGGSGGSGFMGGGGGATVAGGSSSYTGSAGGAGRANPIIGSTIGQLSGGTYYLAGGGGGGGRIDASPADGGAGGLGGGGKGQGGSGFVTSLAGDANTGGGGGGGGFGNGSTCVGRSGGSGVVIIRYQYQ